MERLAERIGTRGARVASFCVISEAGAVGATISNEGFQRHKKVGFRG